MGGRVLIYPVREGEAGTLRYSLRSVAAYLPDARVILAGHRPPWVAGVGHIPVSQPDQDRGNVARILRAVCAHPSTPSEFVLMNDDFYAMPPGPPIPLVHRGPLVHLGRVWWVGWYAQALSNTLAILQARGVPDPLAYDRVHCPLPVTTALMGEALEGVGDGPVLHRSLYGNLVGGGQPGVDAKARQDEPLPDMPWVSTAPSAWNQQAGRTIRKLFPDPCKYEHA